MICYLIDKVGALNGPVEFPVIPGLGEQLPSNAIQLPEALPVPQQGFAWALIAGKLQQLADHRGTVYRTDNGTTQRHTELGELPEGVTPIPRPSAGHHWQNGTWVEDPVHVHELKTAEINQDCMAAIAGGFWSTALEQPYEYDTELQDQLNLNGTILRGIDSLYPCRNGQGVKAFRPHTAAQLRQVGDIFTEYKLRLLQKANELKQRLDQALADGDLAALESVTWESVE